MKFTFYDLNIYSLKCTIQWVLVNSRSCAAIILSFRNILIPWKTPRARESRAPAPQPPPAFSLSLRTSLCSGLLIQMESHHIRSAVTGSFHLARSFQGSPVSSCTGSSFLCVTRQQSILWTHHLLFIHSSADGHLDCVLFWAIMSNSWTFKYRFLCVWTRFHFSWVYAWVELLAHTVTLCLTFWTVAKLCSKVAVPFCSPTSNIWGF